MQTKASRHSSITNQWKYAMSRQRRIQMLQLILPPHDHQPSGSAHVGSCPLQLLDTMPGSRATVQWSEILWYLLKLSSFILKISLIHWYWKIYNIISLIFTISYPCWDVESYHTLKFPPIAQRVDRNRSCGVALTHHLYINTTYDKLRLW